MKKISNLLMMALLTVGMGLTSCDEQLDNAVTPYTPGVTPESEVAASSIALDQTMKVIKLGGDALTITATATPTDATLTWESSDEAVATVVNGVVTPKSVGIATITAKSGDVTATCQVFVGNEVDLGTKTEDYIVQNYDILKGTLNSSYAISIPNDFKVAFNGMKTTKYQITCSGDATIYLADGSENEVNVTKDGKAGIQIGGTGKTLTINAETAGTGTLTVQGGFGGAGIGTSMNGTGGNIVINGGTVTAKGGSCAAGIGTGYTEESTNICSAITINGGTVIATGGGSAAGIGTGLAHNATNTCGDITIIGGTVTATGDSRAAGIGTGISNVDPASANANNTCGAITIGTGVTSVTATKGIDSPNSIGKGYNNGSNAKQNCGPITFGNVPVYDGGGDWTTYNSMTAGTYGDLKLVISKKNVDDDTWTLTPEE